MTRLAWLHLTDLHVGQQRMGWRWPAFRYDFEQDLEKVHRRCGPLRLVLFSGDLVQRGDPTEFDQLDEVLEGIMGRLAQLGSPDVVLLPVPGNHDLSRPDARQPTVRALLNWFGDPQTQQLFWDEPELDYRRVVSRAFAAYQSWWDRWQAAHPLPDDVTLTAGMLPGEYSATVSCGNFSLGLAALNSSFLHLGDSEPGSLELHPRQLNAACGGDAGQWIRQHHLSLLMTHHPPSWLHPNALARYHGEVMAHDWFAAHLAGHVHDAQALTHSEGGGPLRRTLLGTSLFGLELYRDANGEEVQRVHGYSAAQLSCGDDNAAALSHWPRLAAASPGGSGLRLVPDYTHYNLDDGNAWSSPVSLRRPVVVEDDPIIVLDSRSLPQPPGGGYDPDWYVPRLKERTKALATLAQPGPPVVVKAPELCGKTTFLHRIVEHLRCEDQQEGRRSVICLVDLGYMPDGADSDVAVFMQWLAAELVEDYGQAMGLDEDETDGWLSRAWRRPVPPDRKLSRLLERRLLCDKLDRLVLVLDRVERLIDTDVGQPLFRLLRQWMESRLEDERYGKVRLLLAVAPSKTYFTRPDAVSEFFNLALSIRLPRFGLNELRSLARLYDRRWSDAQLQQLLDLADGHPLLTRAVMFEEAVGTEMDTLLNHPNAAREVCSGYLREVWFRLLKDPALLKPYCALLRRPDTVLARGPGQRLTTAGLVQAVRDGDKTVYQPRNRLLAGYIKSQCESLDENDNS